MISRSLTDNRSKLESIFSDCRDLVMLPWRYGTDMKYEALSVYFESLAEPRDQSFMRNTLQSMAAQPLCSADTCMEQTRLFSFFEQHGASINDGVVIDDFQHAEAQLLLGNVLIFLDGWNKAIMYQANNVKARPVDEPSSESVVKGPREGTVENMRTNVGLLRSRLQTSQFKLKNVVTGGKTHTNVLYGYVEDAVPPHTLAAFMKRITKAEEMEILETSYIEELIEDAVYSPFPQHRYTERPDSAVAALLEGKIIVLVEGTGSILVCPGLFTEFFQNSEDYYERTIISTFIRLLRIIAFFIALLLPSVYISLSTFHPELIPTVLLLAVLDTREGIPFPSLVEAVIMMLSFELLREAGIRLPRPVGSAVSIVGALIIGEAAINAGIASPIMVVIIAVTGIASFSIPQYAIAIALRLLQLPLMLLTATMGIFGMMIGLLWITLHLASLKSLGQPYLSPLAPLRLGQLADTLIRSPLTLLNRSPRRAHNRNNPKQSS
ncbi:Spore germination protein B1 [Paenibacillus plantiphilus]|uniref:Spore germination protein B1 n=1 Tax=Paenibacillus plantiphilus TaxID=2905650 RepID=A0ABN8H6H3_9BACL|nr:spore germination protein [Paenibacillus plantiphilus]CAH1224950.1 Spore germination protein B1 [Paenibacillus plantiphilus]